MRKNTMPQSKRLKRRTFFIDEAALLRARKALKVSTDSEVIRVSVERVAEMEEFWSFMDRTRKKLPAGSFESL
jgi:hypothetical protein